MPTQKLNRELLLAAIDGFEFQKLRIDAQIAEIQRQLDGDGAETESEAPKPGRKKFSAAARRKMAASQKARWAKVKGESEPAQAVTPKARKQKRRLSPEGRAAIVAALKKRWAAKKTAAPAKGAKKKTARTPTQVSQAVA